MSQAQALRAQRRAAEAERAAQTAQVRALRYQVNPHFLFNTFNSLSSLIMTGKPDKAESMLLALSTFFRSSLSLDPTADVTLADEIDMQRLYLDIEKVRFPKRLKVEIDVPAELENVRLPALLLQPLVENAIKYGVSASRGTVLLRIAAIPLGTGRMRLDIINQPISGSSPAAETANDVHEGTGVGIANVCQRLQARFGARASCSLRADQGRRIPGVDHASGGRRCLTRTACAYCWPTTNRSRPSGCSCCWRAARASTWSARPATAKRPCALPRR